MNWRTRLCAIALAAMSLPGTATASTLTVDGITFASGAVFNTLTVWQGNEANGGPVQAVGDVLTGVGRVNLIEDGAGGTLWVWGGVGSRELTLHFSGFEVASVTTVSGVTSFGFTGGSVRLYSDAAGNSNPAAGLGSIASFTDGSLWLELAPRALTDGYTLTATQLTSQVVGLGFLDVVGGLAADNFDTDFFALGAAVGSPAADMSFETLGALGLQGTDWAVRGSAKVQAYAVVPIPGSFALLGSGLAWLAVRRRREES